MLTHRRYEPGEVLGQGAQGTVLRVVDRESPRRALVAKVWAADAGRFDATRIGAEFALLARLRVLGLVRAHDFGFDERTRAPFFVEDFAAGVDLTEYLVRESHATERAKRLRSDLAETTQTLAALHA